MSEEIRKVPCEVYSRVVGYLRPVNAWNVGKQQEFADRVVFKLPKTDGEKIRATTDLG